MRLGRKERKVEKPKPPRFFIQQITEHQWQMQEYTAKMGGYSWTVPAAQHCKTKEEALAWINWIVTGPDEAAREGVRHAGEPLIFGPYEYFDDEGNEMADPYADRAA